MRTTDFPYLTPDKTTLEDCILGFLLWIAATVVIGTEVLVLVLVYCFVRSPRLQVIHLLPISFAFLALVNLMAGMVTQSLMPDFRDMLVVVLPIMVIVSGALRVGIFRVFVILCALEVIVGLAEFIVGVSTFFPGLVDGSYDLDDSGLLYNSRVFGLRTNSSTLSGNIFLSILCIYRFSLFKNPKVYYAVVGLLVIGLILTFNRSVIVALVILLALWALKAALQMKHKIVLTGILLAAILFVIRYSEQITRQFLRGGQEIDSSVLERFFFYEQAINVILANPLSGNGSSKLEVWSVGQGIYQHAHNSYLMLFGTHGIPIALILVIFVLFQFYMTDWASRFCLLSIMFYSCFQYGIFWNLSLMDMIFFRFLAFPAQYTTTEETPPDRLCSTRGAMHG